MKPSASSARSACRYRLEEDSKPHLCAARQSGAAGRLHRSRPHNGLPFIPWGIKHIRAQAAWKKSKGNRIRIGVIDTGVDFSHNDLQLCLSKGINLLNRFSSPTDDNGHGTHIAGTIAAASKSGMLGIAPFASIHPVKAFDHLGSAYVSDIINGIEWCVENGMHIINMSFGMKTYSRAMEAAVRKAYKAGIIIVASSGNEGRRGSVDYPARLPQTIAVAAATRKGQVAPFSNTGKQIDIYAPGEKIISTWLRGKYHELSGTSMATSHVTGVIALMLSRNPALTPDQVKQIIKKHGSVLLRNAETRSHIPREIRASRAVAAVSGPIKVSRRASG